MLRMVFRSMADTNQAPVAGATSITTPQDSDINYNAPLNDIIGELSRKDPNSYPSDLEETLWREVYDIIDA